MKFKPVDIFPECNHCFVIAEGKKKCSRHLFKENWCYGLLCFIMTLFLVLEIQKIPNKNSKYYFPMYRFIERPWQKQEKDVHTILTLHIWKLLNIKIWIGTKTFHVIYLDNFGNLAKYIYSNMPSRVII